MTRTRTSVLGATFFLLAGALALTLVLLTGRSSDGNQVRSRRTTSRSFAAARVGRSTPFARRRRPT